MYRESRLRFLMRTQSAAFTVRFVIGDARRFLHRKFFFIQSRQGCRVVTLHYNCAFCNTKCGSSGYTDVSRTDTARNLIGSRESKNGQAVFLLSETLGDCCAGNFALRARCKWRGELRAPRSLQVPHCSQSYRKS